MGDTITFYSVSSALNQLRALQQVQAPRDQARPGSGQERRGKKGDRGACTEMGGGWGAWGGWAEVGVQRWGLLLSLLISWVTVFLSHLLGFQSHSHFLRLHLKL